MCFKCSDIHFVPCAQNTPDPKAMQLNLTGFLEKDAGKFMEELWNLLISAHESLNGIPAIFLEQKKQEIREKMVFFSRLSNELIPPQIEQDRIKAQIQQSRDKVEKEVEERKKQQVM